MRLTRRGRLTVTVAATALAVLAACGVRFAERSGPGTDGEPLGAAAAKPSAPRSERAEGERNGRCIVRAVGQTVMLTPGEAARAAAAAARPFRHHRGRDAIHAALTPQYTHSAALSAAFSGQAQAALACRISSPSLASEPLGPTGLTPRAQRVVDELSDAFGDLPLGGFAPGGVTHGHVEGSAHYEGRAVDVFFRPITPRNQRRGWAITHWIVAHADQLSITAVIYDGKIWSTEHADRGWRSYRHPDGPTNDPTLLHRDHIHVEVADGHH